MSSKLEEYPRPQCSFCKNYATAECDAYDKKRKEICKLLVCHQHKHRTFGVDCCPKHFRSERAHQAERAANSQQSLF